MTTNTETGARAGDYNRGMNLEEAERALASTELVPCLQTSLLEAKELRDACLALDIPVLLDRGACCGKGGCGCAPKLQLFARPQDLPRVSHLLNDRWRKLALREGTVAPDHPAVAARDGDDPPCPACGAVAHLIAGACADCGLQLE